MAWAGSISTAAKALALLVHLLGVFGGASCRPNYSALTSSVATPSAARARVVALLDALCSEAPEYRSTGWPAPPRQGPCRRLRSEAPAAVRRRRGMGFQDMAPGGRSRISPRTVLDREQNVVAVAVSATPSRRWPAGAHRVRTRPATRSLDAEAQPGSDGRCARSRRVPSLPALPVGLYGCARRGSPRPCRPGPSNGGRRYAGIGGIRASNVWLYGEDKERINDNRRCGQIETSADGDDLRKESKALLMVPLYRHFLVHASHFFGLRLAKPSALRKVADKRTTYQ